MESAQMQAVTAAAGFDSMLHEQLLDRRQRIEETYRPRTGAARGKFVDGDECAQAAAIDEVGLREINLNRLESVRQRRLYFLAKRI